MKDVKAEAMRWLADGVPLAVVARWSGTTEEQIREWEEEGTRSPVLKLLHEGKTLAEIAKEMGCDKEGARRLVVEAWRKDKTDHDARSLRRALNRS